MMRWGFGVGLLVGAVVASGAVLAQQATPVVVWTVAPVMKGEVIQALGTLQARESVVLTAKSQNTVQALYFEDNQQVKKGDVLVEMANAEQRAALAEARAAWERVRPLAVEGVVPQSVADERKRAFETARARVDDQTLKAPFDGVVGLRMVSVGGLVQPGQVVTTLDDVRTMKMDVRVPETLAGVLAEGSVVVALVDALGGAQVEGRVAGKDTRVDSATRTVAVRVEMDNSDGALKPGMLARVAFAHNIQPRFMVPEEALLMEGRNAFVLVVNTDASPTTAAKVGVQTGLRVQGFVELTEGVVEGAQIITHGTMKARDGKPVKVVATQDANTDMKALLRGLGDDKQKGGAR